MKRLFLFLSLSLLSAVCYAEVIKLQTTAFSMKLYNEKTDTWGDWSEWEGSSMLVVINLDKERIDIYSPKPQQYDIYKYDGETDDGSGGTVNKFSCIDSEGLKCGIRLRSSSDGSFQLYVDYGDAMMVYSVELK